MIDVGEQDYNRLPSCLNYVRSALNVNSNCSFGPAQQVSIHSVGKKKLSTETGKKKTTKMERK